MCSIIASVSIIRFFRFSAVLIIGILLLGSSTPPANDETARVRAFTRDLEFDYVSWTFNALGIKFGQFALAPADYLSDRSRRQAVLDYLDLIDQIQHTQAQLNDIYANPDIHNPEAIAAPVVRRLDELDDRRNNLGPLAESVLQSQISDTVAKLGLTLGGQPVPPILYRSTPLPTALIVSPREVIRQDENISLKSDLRVDERVKLEQQVDSNLNVSSLVVDIGGIGIYPTMVMQTSDLDFLTEVISHEWVHNFLTLRPLGLNYLSNPELRTINETVAAIAGKEIGLAVLEHYYPDKVPPPPPQTPPETEGPALPPPFDFRAEMRETRVTVDKLLADNKIDAAEEYMQQRRIFFREHGYIIRKLNQAYFAFYGAYADQPGGAAGEDPVGAAVRAFRAKSPSLASFLNRISWITSFKQLEQAVEESHR
ncbi:MAG TPA: hypothetical protein VE136_17945 [Anaerolineales bacterium]|nr:hypothetical protein [Anaerolineales bacterium]